MREASSSLKQKSAVRSRALGVVLALVILAGCRPAAPLAPLPSEAYVWQRTWTPEIPVAVRRTSSGLAGVCVLWREISFRADGAERSPVAVDLEYLATATRRAGFAIRIPFAAGGLDAAPDRVRTIAAEIAMIEQAARQHGVAVTEIQIDYDCPTRQLAGYAAFLGALASRRSGHPPLVPTFLPTWLDDPAWPALARAVPGFVLQVHGLTPPAPGETSRPLCDPVAARHAVEKAASQHVPFRLALPTYTSTGIYDADGKLRAVISEGGSVLALPAARRVHFRSDAASLAQLVRDLNKTRPPELVGLIWYRLPLPADRQNWPLPTFLAVITGRTPLPRITWQLAPLPNGASAIVLTNSGDAAGPTPISLEIGLSGGKLVAFDALAPYAAAVGNNALQLERPAVPIAPLEPGASRTIGWLRTAARPSTNP